MEKNKKYFYQLEFKVRDYECDLQGVVNNANYLHYMEHTRHELWHHLGGNFGKMHEEGIDAFVYKTTVTYKKSLRSGDKFISALTFHLKGAKLIFNQDIISCDGSILYSHAEVEVVTVKDGKITRGEYFADLLKDYL